MTRTAAEIVEENKQMNRRMKTNQMLSRVATIAGIAALAYLLRRAGASWKTSIFVACLVACVAWSILILYASVAVMRAALYGQR